MGQNWLFVWRIAICAFILLGGMLMGCMPDLRAAEPVPTETPQREMKILFIGNSYTFANDFPAIFADLAQEGGYHPEITMRAAGGWTLMRYAESKETLAQIHQTAWHYVVLQEQSVIPTDPTQRAQSMYPAVRRLNTEISQSGAETLLFLTWGQRDGLPEKGYQSAAEMQTEITAGYMEIANELDVAVAPVGEAWQRSQDQSVEFDLWQRDGSHPSRAGSYLTACVFYAVVFRESPEGLAYVAGLAEEVAYLLQSIAAETVLEHPEQWNLK